MAGDPSYVFGKDWRGGMLVGASSSITRETSSGTDRVQADGRWLAVEQPAGTPIHYAMQIEPRRLLALIDTSDGVRRVHALTGAPVAPGLAPTELGVEQIQRVPP